VTETDLVTKVLGRTPIRQLTAGDIMSYPIDRGHRVARDPHEMMGDQRIRHLMVTRDGKPVGLISVGPSGCRV
jgi:signal-transduction protein with cAMP-binding, CBS, and nucleotidyltransferase domain